MRYISMTLICTAIILAGLDSAAENRKKIAAKKTLAGLFGCIADKISEYACAFVGAVELAALSGADGDFSFPKATVSEYSAGQDLVVLWNDAAENDCLLKKTGSVNAVKDLSNHFADAAPESVARACRRLSERLSAEAEEAQSAGSKNERLSLAFSFLGAAVVMIVML